MEKATTIGIDFCGIRCENPFFLATSPAYADYDSLSRALKAGWAGVFYAMDGGGNELDLLNSADMQINGKGELVSYAERLEDIAARGTIRIGTTGDSNPLYVIDGVAAQTVVFRIMANHLSKPVFYQQSISLDDMNL